MRRNSPIVIGLLLLAAAGGIFVVKWRGSSNGTSEPTKVEPPGKHVTEPSSPSSAQAVSVGGIGEIKFKSVETQVSSIDWLRRLKMDSDDSLLRRMEVDGWNKPDVYFGENGEILHIAVNKGNYKTIPFDSQALKKLQDEQGFSVIGAGYPSGLLESGYTSDDFIKATSEYWDRGMGDANVEIEITPVMVEIVPTGMPIDDNRKPFLHQKFPMILVKWAYGAPPLSEAAILTESKFDSVPVEKRVRRSWALKPYTRKAGASDGIEIPRGGVLFDEPLKEAWEQARSEERSK